MLLPNALLVKLYGNHGKCKPELNTYFYMYRYQLYIVIFYATSAPGISWEQLYPANLLVRSAYRFCVHFHVRMILHHLGNSLPNEDGFSKVKNSYIKKAYYSICDGCGVNSDERWTNGDYFCLAKYVLVME